MKTKLLAVLVPGGLLLTNVGTAQIADSTITLNTTGQGSYLTTYNPFSTPSSGTYNATLYTAFPGVTGYTYSDGYYGGSIFNGNAILADSTGTTAYGDLIITEGASESGDGGTLWTSTVTLLKLNTPESVTTLETALGGDVNGDIFVDVNSAGNVWTYTPTSAQPGFITATTPDPSSFVTTYDLTLVPESSHTGAALGMGALLALGLSSRRWARS